MKLLNILFGWTFLDELPEHVILIAGGIMLLLTFGFILWAYNYSKKRDNKLPKIEEDNLLELDEEPVLEISGLEDLINTEKELKSLRKEAYQRKTEPVVKEDNKPRKVRTNVLDMEINDKFRPAVLKYSIEAGDIIEVVLNSDKNLDLAVALRDFKVNQDTLVLENIDPDNLGTKAGALSKGKSHIDVSEKGIDIEYDNLSNFKDGFRLKTGGYLRFHFNESYENFEFTVLFETGDYKHFKDVTVKLNPEK